MGESMGGGCEGSMRAGGASSGVSRRIASS